MTTLSTQKSALRSALYACQVWHSRIHPRAYAFRYRLYYLLLDLDELPELHERFALFSVDGPNWSSFRQDDYLPCERPAYHASKSSVPTAAAPSGLKQRVLNFLSSEGITAQADARVTLLTMPRVAGYAFNPVSFYFIQNRDGTLLGGIAEVTNTFREMKAFALRPTADDPLRLHARVPKHFYVSPFSSLDTEFDFSVRLPASSLRVAIDDYAGGRVLLHSTLNGERLPLDELTQAACLLRHPLMPLHSMFRIHWHALRLWLKGLPFHAKAANPELQRDLFKPHRSLTQAQHS